MLKETNFLQFQHLFKTSRYQATLSRLHNHPPLNENYSNNSLIWSAPRMPCLMSNTQTGHNVNLMVTSCSPTPSSYQSVRPLEYEPRMIYDAWWGRYNSLALQEWNSRRHNYCFSLYSFLELHVIVTCTVFNLLGPTGWLKSTLTTICVTLKRALILQLN